MSKTPIKVYTSYCLFRKIMLIDCKASTIDRIFLVKMIVKISGKFLNKTALKVKNEKLQIIKVYGISADHS